MEIQISGRRLRSAHARLTYLKICCRSLSTGFRDESQWTEIFLCRDVRVLGVPRVLFDHESMVEEALHMLLPTMLANRVPKEQGS